MGVHQARLLLLLSVSNTIQCLVQLYLQYVLLVSGKAGEYPPLSARKCQLLLLMQAMSLMLDRSSQVLLH